MGNKKEKEITVTRSKECVVPTTEHQPGIATDEGLSMSMEVAEHGVTTPVPDNADLVRVDAGEEESHSSTCTKRAGSYLVGMDTGMPWDGQGSRAKEARYHGRGDGAASAIFVEIDMKRSRCRGVVPLEVSNATESGPNWASFCLPINTVRELFTFDAIFLRGEG